MATYKIKDGQSIFDIAVQKYGDISQTIRLIKDNLEVLENVNNANISGKNIEVDESRNVNVQNWLNKNININTSDPVIQDGYAYTVGFTTGFFS